MTTKLRATQETSYVRKDLALAQMQTQRKVRIAAASTRCKKYYYHDQLPISGLCTKTFGGNWKLEKNAFC